MIRTGKLDLAERRAAELCKKLEAMFDPALKQIVFTTKEEFEQFKAGQAGKFEWIDYSYKQCLEAQAFMASERRDYPAALRQLKVMESVVPISASVAAETGHILGQL